MEHPRELAPLVKEAEPTGLIGRFFRSLAPKRTIQRWSAVLASSDAWGGTSIASEVVLPPDVVQALLAPFREKHLSVIPWCADFQGGGFREPASRPLPVAEGFPVARSLAKAQAVIAERGPGSRVTLASWPVAVERRRKIAVWHWRDFQGNPRHYRDTLDYEIDRQYARDNPDMPDSDAIARLFEWLDEEVNH
ncbi:MAG: hypothetical protein AAGE52_13095 [Myxococcota bacterium]